MERYLLRSGKKTETGGEEEEADGVGKMAAAEAAVIQNGAQLHRSQELQGSTRPVQRRLCEERSESRTEEQGEEEESSSSSSGSREQQSKTQLMGENVALTQGIKDIIPALCALIDYERMADEVAKRLAPDITASLAVTVQTTLNELKDKTSVHEERLEEAEIRVGKLESALEKAEGEIVVLQKQVTTLAARSEDQENRSRRNNIRLVGLPESVPQRQLKDIFESEVPQALGMKAKCRVERAHRVGSLQPDAACNNPRRPRQAVAKYLDFNDKEEILRTFRRRKEPLTIQGHKVILFNDFSSEVTKKRKLFSPCCTELYKNGVQFQLLYPAMLRIRMPDGSTKSFQDARTAETFVKELLQKDPPNASPTRGGGRNNSKNSPQMRKENAEPPADSEEGGSGMNT